MRTSCYVFRTILWKRKKMLLKLCTTGADLCLRIQSCTTVADIEHSLGLENGACYLLSNGRVVSRSQQLQDDNTYHIIPRVLGGKGGFGSMLRAIGAQIEKTTSREACRDLSGRRVRDVNNEKKLKEWVAKQAEREREKEERRRLRREKRERLLAEPQPKLEDPTYHEEYAKAQENLQSALQEGLQKAKEKERKRKAAEPASGPSAKRLDWLGVGINPEDLDSDSDSDQSCNSSSNGSAGPSTSDKPSSSKASATVTSASAEEDGSSCSSSSVSGAEGGNIKQEHLDTSQSGSLHTEQHTGTDESNSSSNSGSLGFAVQQEGTEPDDTVKCKTETESEATGANTPDSNGTTQTEPKHGLLSALPPPASSTNGGDSKSNGDMGPVDLDAYSDAKEIERLGLEHLKAELTRRGLKCGGSLEERAQRLFSVKGLLPEEINPKLLAKPAKGKGQGKNRQ